jgi:hypothetical protein
MRDHYELGKCRPSQESIVHNLKIGHLELYGFSLKVLPSPEGYRKRDLTDGRHCCTGDYIPWKGARLVCRMDLDSPIWSKVFRKRMLSELPPSMSTQLSLTSFTMGILPGETALALL